jgi:membrane-associated phospholipid phosphatase
MPTRGLNTRVLAIACATAFVVLAVLVASGALDALDVHLRDVFRPHDHWTRVQTAGDHVIEDLRPPVAATVLALVAVGASVMRRSWRPAAYALVVGAVSMGLTVGTKVLLGRPGPRGAATTHGGSFPSGHTVSIVVCLGTALLILWPESTRLWQWAIVGLLGCVMGVSLLLVAAHWVTDVVGAGLLSVAILATASRWAICTVPDRDAQGVLRDSEPARR